MTVNAFFEAYERTIKGLPSLLSRWETIPEELRDHYCDEIVYILTARLALVTRCANWGVQGRQLRTRIAAADVHLRRISLLLAQKTQIDIDEFLATPHTSVARPISDTVSAEKADSLPLAA
jgi:hypothetical protein